MANLWAEGLGGIATGTSQSGYRFDSTTSCSITTSTSPVPPNGQAARSAGNFGGSAECARKNVTTHTAGFFGGRYLASDIGTTVSSYYILCAFHDSAGVRNFVVDINSAGRIEVRNNALTVLGTGTSALSLVDWFYLEVSYTMSATVGAVEVKTTRGSTVTTEMTLTGINNVNGAANCGAVTPLWVRSDGSGQTYSPAVADMYLNDNSGGGANATYWGDTRYVYMVPDGAGNSTQLTPNTGANWQAVDELPGHNTDTDYVESNTVTNKDLYTTSNPVTTATTIRDVKAIITARAPAGGANLKVDIRSGGTTSAGSSVALSTGAYAEVYRSFGATNPVSTAAWTLSDLNALELGFEVA